MWTNVVSSLYLLRARKGWIRQEEENDWRQLFQDLIQE